MVNNASERALHGLALDHKARLIARTDRNGQRSVLYNGLIVPAKLNDVDLEVWLPDTIGRTASHLTQRLHESLQRI